MENNQNTILEHVLAQFTKHLNQVAQDKKNFVEHGILAQILKIKGEGEGSKLKTYIEDIKGFYPPEIWQYYSPDYKEKLL